MNALELRRRTLGKGVYKKTVEGNPAIAQGSLARRYLGITMQGWTEQAQYEGKNLIDYKNAVARNNKQTVEIIDNGIKWSGDYYFKIPVSGIDPGETYTFSFTSEYCVNWAFGYSDGFISTQMYKGNPITTDPDKQVSEILVFKINPEIYENDMVTQNIMLNSGSTALAYEPYTGRKPSPNPDYPQEIVSAGKYDEETGKYQYEINVSDAEENPTKSQTVLLTSDRQLTKWDKLEKRDGVWGWVYKSGSYSFDGSTDENWNVTASSKYTFTIDINGAMFNNSFCDRYICEPGSWASNKFGIYSDNGFATKYFRPPSAEVQTVEQWRTWLSENPLTLWYETAEETFVPLSETEQDQMNELYTFRPTTVLSNDCDCNMTLTYKTKKSLEVAT